MRFKEGDLAIVFDKKAPNGFFIVKITGVLSLILEGDIIYTADVLSQSPNKTRLLYESELHRPTEEDLVYGV